MSLNENRSHNMNHSPKLDYWQQKYDKLEHNPEALNPEYQKFLHKAVAAKGTDDSKLSMLEVKLKEYKDKGMNFAKYHTLEKEDISKLSPVERLGYRDFMVSRVFTDKITARAQANLVIAGYDLGQTGTYGVDGECGPLTTRAIEDFQKSAGLKVTGKLDQETVRALDLMTKLGMTKREIEGIGKQEVIHHSSEQEPLRSNTNNIGNFSYNYQIERFVSIAEQELYKGYKEINGNNKTPYGKWYGMDGQPWCAMFVSWCADQAGILDTTVPRFSSVQAGKDWYIEKGKYQSRETGYIPKAGDVIFFKNKKGQSHTGIVAAYDEKTNTVYTIEGNSSDSVAARKYNLNNNYIQGFGVNGGTSNGEIPKKSTNGIGLNTR